MNADTIIVLNLFVILGLDCVTFHMAWFVSGGGAAMKFKAN